MTVSATYRADLAPNPIRGLRAARGPGSSPGQGRLLALVSLLLLVLAHPAQAKSNYCYFGDTPDGVSAYPDLPPRSFGFENASIPFIVKRMCGLPAAAEADHIRRILVDYVQCTPTSDLGQATEEGLTSSDADIAANYFPDLPTGDTPEWAAVCAAAETASVENLAFGDAWYYDSDTPDADLTRIRDLLNAVNAWIASEEAKQ